MSITFPFENRAAQALSNNLGFGGGFYPLGENNLWHGGVHLQSVVDPETHLLRPIKTAYQGELVCSRFSETYISQDLPERLSADEVRNLNTRGRAVVLRHYTERETGGLIFFEKNTGTMSPEDEGELKSTLNLYYSNSFALVRHQAHTPFGQAITFYTLYMHLKPYGLLSEEDTSRLFYFHKTITAEAEYASLGLALYQHKNGTGIRKYLPEESYLEVTTDPLWHLPEENTTLAQVRSRYLPHQGMEGFINLSYCTLVEEASYKAARELEFYHRDSGELIGTIPADTLLTIPDQETYVEDRDDERRHQKAARQTGNRHVYLRVASGELVISQEMARQGELRYYPANRPFRRTSDGRYVMTQDADLYKDRWGFSAKKLYEGDEIEIVDTPDRGLLGMLHTEVRLKLDGIVDGLVYITEADITITPAVYQVQSRLHAREGAAGEIGRGDKTGIRVRRIPGRYRDEERRICNEAIDIISRGDPVYFEDLDRFLDLRFGESSSAYLKLDPAFYDYPEGEAYVYVGAGEENREEYQVAFDLTPPDYAKDVERNGEVVFYGDPIPIPSSAVLGYAGDMLEDKDIVHFELFTDNTDFLTPMKKDGTIEDKPVYRIEPGTTGFKRCADIAVKAPREHAIPGLSCLEIIMHDGERLGSLPFSNARRVRRASGTPIEAWVLWVPETWDTAMRWDGHRYKGQADTHINVFTSCPTEQEKEPESVEVVIYEDETFELIATSATIPQALSGQTQSEYGDYRKFRFHRALEDGETSQTFFIDLTETTTKAIIENRIIELQENLTEVYDANPEQHDFSEDDTREITQQHHFERIRDIALDVHDNRYVLIETSPDTEAWIAEDLFTRVITRLNYFNWGDFFQEFDDPNKDGIMELGELLANVLPPGVSVPGTLAEGGVLAALRNDEIREAANKLIVKHKSEWDTKSNDYFNALKRHPYRLSDPEVEEVRAFSSNLDFWQEAAAVLPASDNLTFFHPVTFLTHLEKVTQVDWIEFIEGMQLIDDQYYAGRIRDKEIRILHSYNTRELTLTGLRSEVITEDGKTRGENMKMVLNTCLDFLFDPEADDLNSIQINCFFQTEGRSRASSHRTGLAIDLGGPDFKFNDQTIPFDKEKALRYANILGRLGVKAILFNCQYVIDKAEYRNVYGHKQHEHHFHLDFHYSSFSSASSNFNCWGRYKSTDGELERYSCCNYENCNYKQKRPLQS
ncbi:hypothetical protein [Sediminispirochaeta bajacaliforniensis]|uniref:hypothetical protein n=1 Tax=Sediminispirochaeta bajacaliforniensis TaxID=148 RepID=UPI0003604A31|nr:hypothetical protein [Sediminispirochaeta bajacaliforniensis]